MSGIEVAGITLAIFSATIQCLGGRKAITSIVRRSADFQRLNRRTRMKLFLQEKNFMHQCQRLLAGLRSKSEIDAMFGDENEDNLFWKDDGWEKELQDHLGPAFNEITTAIELVLLELDTIRKLLDKSDSPKSGVAAFESRKLGLTGLNHSDDILAKTSLPFLTKKRMASTGEKLVHHLESLKDSIDEYRQVVTRFLDKKFDWNSLDKRPSRASRKSNLELSTIRLLRERARQLHGMLQYSGNCPCHLLNLRLGFGDDFLDHRNEVTLQSQAVFRLVAMCEAQGPGLESLIDIDGGRSISRKQLQILEVKPRLIIPEKGLPPKICKDTFSGSKPICMKVPELSNKRVGFSIDLPKVAAKRHLTADEGNHPLEEIEDTPKVTEIDSLCVSLSQIRPGQSAAARILSPPCLGYLSGADDYRYLVYKISNLNPNMKDQSLQDLLQSESKEMRLSVRNRLQLSFTLALSLLQLHSSPWITERLRSRDVVLIREGNQKWSPYVSATFDAISHGKRPSTETAATNHHDLRLRSCAIFSLGVILLEIGRSRLLMEPVRSMGNGDAAELDAPAENELREHLEACRQVMKKSVAGELGPRYQDVVEKCILWEEDDDLSDILVQKRFCEQVVCELDICLSKFDDQ